MGTGGMFYTVKGVTSVSQHAYCIISVVESLSYILVIDWDIIMKQVKAQVRVRIKVKVQGRTAPPPRRAPAKFRRFHCIPSQSVGFRVWKLEVGVSGLG
jgi:hypothetical protein